MQFFAEQATIGKIHTEATKVRNWAWLFTRVVFSCDIRYRNSSVYSTESSLRLRKDKTRLTGDEEIFGMTGFLFCKLKSSTNQWEDVSKDSCKIDQKAHRSPVAGWERSLIR